jgi:hypothetical protein
MNTMKSGSISPVSLELAGRHFLFAFSFEDA